jgi:hypothetical protein
MSAYKKMIGSVPLTNPEPKMPAFFLDDDEYNEIMNAMNNPAGEGHGLGWWAGVVVGLGLVVFPEPATTATGLAILGATFALGGKS